MESTNKIIAAAIQRWLPVIMAVLNRRPDNDREAEHLAALRTACCANTMAVAAMACVCEAQDNSRYARSLDRDLDNIEIWENLQLMAAAEKFLYASLKANFGVLMPELGNPDVYTYWARYWGL